MAHLEFGPRLLDRMMEHLSEIAEKDKPERMEGRRLVTLIKPIKRAAINKKPETGNQRQEIVNTEQETKKH